MEGRTDNQILEVRVKEAISQWKRRKMHWMVVKVGWENIASASTNLCCFTVQAHKQQKRYYKISTQKTPIQKYVYFTLTGGQMS